VRSALNFNQSTIALLEPSERRVTCHPKPLDITTKARRGFTEFLHSVEATASTNFATRAALNRHELRKNEKLRGEAFFWKDFQNSHVVKVEANLRYGGEIGCYAAANIQIDCWFETNQVSEH